MRQIIRSKSGTSAVVVKQSSEGVLFHAYLLVNIDPECPDNHLNGDVTGIKKAAINLGTIQKWAEKQLNRGL